MLRFGDAPFLECSSKGDKRFSAFYARVERNGVIKSIEDWYQGAKKFSDLSTNLSWREAKGKKPINVEEVRKLYSELWDQYIRNKPELLEILKEAKGLSDIFGQRDHACQAEELWRIRNENS